MTTPQENFTTWLTEHYDIAPEAPHGDGPDWICKRCGQRVGYVTKHAVTRHGDDIQVMPVSRGNLKSAIALIY